MSSSLSATETIVLAAIRGGRRPAIPSKNQLAPAGCPLDRLGLNCRLVGIAGPEYTRTIKSLLRKEVTVLIGWAVKTGVVRHGRRQVLIPLELIPDWFCLSCETYTTNSSGQTLNPAELAIKLRGVSSQLDQKRITSQYESLTVQELKIHILSDKLTLGAQKVYDTGLGPDELTYELRTLAKNF